jgi:hypothetical protein
LIVSHRGEPQMACFAPGRDDEECQMFTRIDDLPAGAIGVVARGRVTGEDRRSMLEPSIADVLGEHGRVRLLYVAGADFAGYESGGLYDEAIFGTRHFADFERIAFVAEDGPYRRAVGAMNGLMPAAVRLFEPAEIAMAREWVAG